MRWPARKHNFAKSNKGEDAAYLARPYLRLCPGCAGEGEGLLPDKLEEPPETCPRCLGDGAYASPAGRRVLEFLRWERRTENLP